MAMEPFDGRLAQAVVGIAGVGGLGSTVAAALARTGIGRLILVDFDRVEESNLNRQHYLVDQIGQPKATAMAENLRRINPAVRVDAHVCRLDSGSICELFAETQVVAECFDRADQKRMIVETVLGRMTQPVVSASGLAGYGDSNRIGTERLNPRWIMVGDRESDVNTGLPLTAGRVWIAAAHQANAIVALLVDEIL
jgi:sulfur carrier protein ThiS adenylyltransferase